MNFLYLDNAATTPISAAVREAIRPFLEDEFGNPSSRHPAGQRAARAVEEARRAVARALGGRDQDVFFTSGGTESNNLAVLGLARARAKHGRHVVIGPTEHPSVRESALALSDEGFEVESARLDPDGRLDLVDFGARLRPDTVLVAQMLVNNEFGTVYPVAKLGRMVRASSPHAALHVDAVQALGKLDVRLHELGAHSLSISAHKIHGPKGVGACLFAEGVRPAPLVHGGGQESGVRSGTENVIGIVGLGAATRLADEEREARVAAMARARDVLVDALRDAPCVRVLEPGAERVPNIVSLEVKGPPSEVVMHHLETHGVYVSAGSACHAKSTDLSPALVALGLSDEGARRVLRVSFSSETSPDAAAEAARVLDQVTRELEAVAG